MQESFIAIAKRENNKKRSYLIVNQLQGKHVPVQPRLAFDLFLQLGKILEKEYSSKKLLLIGFAETATAIGAVIGAYLKCTYIQTTREELENVEYLFFSEAHSHATEQRLVKNGLETAMAEAEKVLFIEDEITTGNTILNILEILEKTYQRNFDFGVASILNGMDELAQKRYKEKNISIHMLQKTEHEAYEKAMEGMVENNSYWKPSSKKKHFNYKKVFCTGYMDARRLLQGEAYEEACRTLLQQILSQVDIKKGEQSLVLGTEEFMYPGLFVAKEMEAMGLSVLFHSTTRSPICVSDTEGYPLKKRYQLTSLYEEERITYVYDLAQYDNVMIITDASGESSTGLSSLLEALESNGNQNFYFIRWC